MNPQSGTLSAVQLAGSAQMLSSGLVKLMSKKFCVTQPYCTCKRSVSLLASMGHLRTSTPGKSKARYTSCSCAVAA